VDPGGRDGARAPIPWTSGAGHGWGDVEPWLPFPPEAGSHNPEVERADAGSILHLYRRLLAARRASPALQLGTWTQLDAPDGVLAYTRTQDEDRRAVLVNYTSARVQADVPGAWSVEVASDGHAEGVPYGGTLSPDQAVVLRPAS
jgi:alpha-glucosidase